MILGGRRNGSAQVGLLQEGAEGHHDDEGHPEVQQVGDRELKGPH